MLKDNCAIMENMENIRLDTSGTPLLYSTNEVSDTESTFGNRKITVDEALVSIGSYGRFQIVMQVVFMFFLITVGYQAVFSYFIGDSPAWRCSANSTRNLSDSFCYQHFGEEIHVDSLFFDERCKLAREDWTYTTDRLYSYVTEFDLVCDKKGIAAFLSGAVFLGGIFQLFTGPLMDMIGRKVVLPIMLSLGICFSFGCSYVTTVWELIVLRVALGCSIWTAYVGGILLLAEYMPPKSRALSISIYLIANTISLLLCGTLAMYVPAWRKLNIYAAIPSIISFFLLLFVPQSPRWLLSNQKTASAERVLEKISRWNGKTVNGISLKTSTSIQKVYTYIDLLVNVKALLVTVTLGLIYGTMALVYYEIALESSNLGGNIYKTFILAALADIPSFFVAFWLCNRFGRKQTVTSCLFISGIIIGSIATIPHDYSGRYTARIVLALISKVFVNIGFLGLYVWSFELFPTVIRSQGCGVASVIEKVGALCVPLITAALSSVNPILVYIVIGLIAILASLIGCALEETNDQPTRENYDDLTCSHAR